MLWRKQSKKIEGRGGNAKRRSQVADSGRWSVLVTFMYRDMRR